MSYIGFSHTRKKILSANWVRSLYNLIFHRYFCRQETHRKQLLVYSF